MSYQVKRYQCFHNNHSKMDPPLNVTAKVYETAGCALEGDRGGKPFDIPQPIELMVRFMVECECQKCTLDAVSITVPGSANVYAAVKRVP